MLLSLVRGTDGPSKCQIKSEYFHPKDYEFRTDTSETLIRIAMIGLMTRRLAR